MIQRGARPSGGPVRAKSCATTQAGVNKRARPFGGPAVRAKSWETTQAGESEDAATLRNTQINSAPEGGRSFKLWARLKERREELRARGEEEEQEGAERGAAFSWRQEQVRGQLAHGGRASGDHLPRRRVDGPPQVGGVLGAAERRGSGGAAPCAGGGSGEGGSERGAGAEEAAQGGECPIRR